MAYNPSKFTYGSTNTFAVTALQTVANSATVGWQSVRVSNLSNLARDYEISVRLTATGAPANDKAAYVYACPWYWDSTASGGSGAFVASSQGTATLPSGSDASTTIASPNNLRLLGVLPYPATTAVMNDTFLLSNAFGDRMPDAFSIIIINYTGVALTSGVVQYTAINDTIL